MDRSNAKIFVTGATGLVGAHVVELLLARGYQNISALKRANSRMDLTTGFKDRVRWVEGDLSNKAALFAGMEDADWVIHCAAMIGQARRFAQQMYEINTRGTARVVDTALESGVRKLLHVSSISVFTRTGGEQHITEKTPWQRTPYTTEYGFSKYGAEMEVYRGQAEGLDVAVINPSIILGPGFWNTGSTAIFSQIWNGLKLYPVGVNGYVDVRDVAHLAVLRLEQDWGADRMLVNAANLDYLDIFHRVAKALDRKPPSLRLSPFATELAWRILKPVEWLTGKPAVITKERARTTKCRLHFDNALSLTVPGFKYSAIDDTITDIATIIKERGGKNFTPSTLAFLPHHLA